MSFSTKITFVPRDSGVNSISFDIIDIGLIPPGSGLLKMKEQLFQTYKSLYFREISSPGYYDYVSILTLEEFIDFYEINCTPNSQNLELSQFVNTKLEQTRFNWVIIEIYEWESGLE